jgi:hypothetical protein
MLGKVCIFHFNYDAPEAVALKIEREKLRGPLANIKKRPSMRRAHPECADCDSARERRAENANIAPSKAGERVGDADALDGFEGYIDAAPEAKQSAPSEDIEMKRVPPYRYFDHKRKEEFVARARTPALRRRARRPAPLFPERLRFLQQLRDCLFEFGRTCGVDFYWMQIYPCFVLCFQALDCAFYSPDVAEFAQQLR